MRPRNLTILILAGLLAASTVMAAGAPKLPPGKWWENPRLVRELGLTPEQQATIHDLVFEHAKRMIDLNAAVKRAELVLGDLADREPFDEDAVRRAWEEFQKARHALQRERFELLLSVRKVLTTEQWSKLRQARELRRRKLRERRFPGGPQGAPRPPRQSPPSAPPR